MGVLYADLVNGSNFASLGTLTTCIASNPSGTITRITKTAHGLVNGQMVQLTLFSSWLNRVWFVTNVQTDTFDLEDAVWQTTADNNGSVSYYNGYSWATAIKNPNSPTSSFATTRRPQIDIRLAKTANPTSIGNATWTNGSGTVTLATAQTATIDNCETAWTAANSSTVTAVTTTPVKQGTNRLQITMPASGITTATKYAYRTLPATLDLSAYQRISYWLQPGATNAIDADTEYKICLCSDTLGNTIVDEFYLKRNTITGTRNIPYVITRNGGGNLGSSIQSIALYTNTTTPTASGVLRFDNIIATKTDGLNLTSLISKCNSATYDHSQDPWFPIDYIDGTDVQLSVTLSSGWSGAPNSYYKYFTEGTSPQTVTTYCVNPLDYNNYDYTAFQLATCMLITTSEYGEASLVGGYNTTSGNIDGMTWLSGAHNGATIVNEQTSTSSSNTYGGLTVKNFGVVDYNYIANFGGAYHEKLTLENCHCVRYADSSVYTASSATGLPAVANIKITNFTQNNAVSNRNIPMDASNVYIDNYKNIGDKTSANFRIYNGTFKNVFMTANDYGSEYGHSFYAMENVETSNITIANTVVPVVTSNNVGATFYTGGRIVISGLTIKNCYTAVNLNARDNTYGDVILNSPTFSNNTYTIIYGSGAGNGQIIFNNATRTDTNMYNMLNPKIGTNLNIRFVNSMPGGDKNNTTHYIKDFGLPYTNTASLSATILAQTTTRHTASGIAWQINPLINKYNEEYPLYFKIASVAVNSGSLVTVKAWLKLSHATDIGAKLYIPGGQPSGPTNSTTATKSADTNWEELSVTFTPSLQGIVDVYVEAYWLANTADESVYVDDITVTQA